MKIWKNLRPQHIFLDISCNDKDSVFRFIARTFAEDGVINDPVALFEAMREREQTMTTGVGKGIGIPHAVSSETDVVSIILIRLKDPINFEAIDGSPVDVVFGLVIPENRMSLHLRMLAGISRLCQTSEFLTAVRAALDSASLWNAIKLMEDKMAFHFVDNISDALHVALVKPKSKKKGASKGKTTRSQ